ncbi:rCG55153 [Rattus norvegicus]|uniref:RCG55153 n=1 Tax=Rattus norvegicus TaxID=10116 RepID=A6IIH9_RAT|nr:rCG55153 [Rattus norvegicus]
MFSMKVMLKEFSSGNELSTLLPGRHI